MKVNKYDLRLSILADRNEPQEKEQTIRLNSTDETRLGLRTITLPEYNGQRCQTRSKRPMSISGLLSVWSSRAINW